jgi:hypothetical protein
MLSQQAMACAHEQLSFYATFSSTFSATQLG